MNLNLVRFAGAQDDIFVNGKASPVISVAHILEDGASFGVGAMAQLDGELTVYMGRPLVTKVRNQACVLNQENDGCTTFAVWTRHNDWRTQSIPATVDGYVDLQKFVKARAAKCGIDVAQPFPFRLTGTPRQVRWHVNVNLTGGKPVTRELFVKSKANYVAHQRPMDIVGFYSDHHRGTFISANAPAIKPESGVANAVHMHLVTHDGNMAGHIDDLTLAPGMELLLPQIEN